MAVRDARMKRRRAAASNHLPLTNVHTTWGRLEKVAAAQTLGRTSLCAAAARHVDPKVLLSVALTDGCD